MANDVFSAGRLMEAYRVLRTFEVERARTWVIRIPEFTAEQIARAYKRENRRMAQGNRKANYARRPKPARNHRATLKGRRG